MEQGQQQKQMQDLRDYAVPGIANTKRWRQIWRQRLIVTLLVLLDVLVALLALGLATLLQSVWGRG